MTVVIASLNPAIERLLVVERNLPGTVHRLRDSQTLAGGKGVNVARVLKQLGGEHRPSGTPRRDDVEPLLVGPLGGPTGELEATLLGEEGLAARSLPIGDWTRINEVLIDESEPDRATVYNAPGPSLRTGELAELRDLAVSSLDGARLLVCTGSLPAGLPSSFYGEWIAEARRRGLPTLLDAHGEALERGAAAAPTIVKVNRDELDELATAVDRTAGQLTDEWIAGGSSIVIVTDGSSPVVAQTADRRYSVESPQVPTRSAVGSGDAFTAGLVWSLLTGGDGADWGSHLAMAAACGASNAASTLARLAAELPPAALLPRVVVREAVIGS